jgi:signal transduction histidine kinase
MWVMRECMLHEFLELNRDDILELCEEKTINLAGARGGSEQLKLGLPLFYEQLIKVLELKLNSDPTPEMLMVAAEHGKEFLRLGYSLSHVVHAYGAMCQAITELAVEKDAKITAQEFNILNASLDAAIAAAVSEFQFTSNQGVEEREVQHLGFLTHELRNALSSATVAYDMIKAGLVGIGGSTSAILEANLSRMRLLIDRSLTEVRLRADADLIIEKIRLFDIFEQIAITARIDAGKKKQTLAVEVDLEIEIETDRQIVLSAISNLVQNAIKYTRREGLIFLRGKIFEDRVLIEIEDQCGGLVGDKISSLFQPFIQENEDRSGLGLGLSIAKKAIYLCQGTVSVENKPGIGCIFIINIPIKVFLLPSAKPAVRGKDSVQPKNFKKK